MVELKLIVCFIDNKKYIKGSLFFTTLHEECVGKYFYSYERKDNQSISDEVQVNLMTMIESLSEL